MHDPMTVAHEIKWPIKNKYGHRIPFITIWHVDPETDGSDDSCGFSFPKISEVERKMLHKLAADQFPQMYARKMALKEEKSYAYICYNQDIYGCIYWMWRAFNRAYNKEVWQYGKDLTLKELQYVYVLAYNPVDNFQSHKLNTVEEFEEFLYLIYRSWKRYKRPWYKHARWHMRHWKIQVHPWQTLKRRYWDKCSVCGKRGFKGSAYSNWDGDKIWHSHCDTSAKTHPLPQTKG